MPVFKKHTAKKSCFCTKESNQIPLPTQKRGREFLCPSFLAEFYKILHFLHDYPQILGRLGGLSPPSSPSSGFGSDVSEEDGSSSVLEEGTEEESGAEEESGTEGTDELAPGVT